MQIEKKKKNIDHFLSRTKGHAETYPGPRKDPSPRWSQHKAYVE